MKFPEKYILHGDFVLHGGQRSDVKYDVEELMTNPIYFNHILRAIPFRDHYIGIATGGALMAVMAHARNPGTQFSYIKKEGLLATN